MTEERAFLLFWMAVEYVTSDEGLILGGIALLVIAAAVVVAKEGIRLAHEYMRSL